MVSLCEKRYKGGYWPTPDQRGTLFKRVSRPGRDSNPDRKLRRLPGYPLPYQGTEGAKNCSVFHINRVWNGIIILGLRHIISSCQSGRTIIIPWEAENGEGGAVSCYFLTRIASDWKQRWSGESSEDFPEPGGVRLIPGKRQGIGQHVIQVFLTR